MDRFNAGLDAVPSADTDVDAPAAGRLGPVGFCRACAQELRLVQWPDRSQTLTLVAVVLMFVVLAGGFLGLVDALAQLLVDALL